MSEVVINFESADGSQTAARKYEVRDLDDFLVGLENGTHGRIIDQLGPTIRNELGPGARYVSTTVDGVLQGG